MRQERINENKIRFILDKSDLEERGIELPNLAYGAPGTKELFEELMSIAREELGIPEGVHPMMVEAIPMKNEGLVVNVSRVDNPDELDPRFARFTNGMEYNQGPAGDLDYQAEGPEEDEEGPDRDEDEEDGPPVEGPMSQEFDTPEPDGIQVQQGPEIRAEINIPKSIDPKDIMSVIDNIMSGLADKLGGGSRVTGNPPRQEVKKAPGEEASGDRVALFEFRDLQSVIRVAKVLKGRYHSENILYKNKVKNRYYLYIGREHNTAVEFAEAVSILSENGSRCRISYAVKEYFDEHTEKILDNALDVLESLED